MLKIMLKDYATMTEYKKVFLDTTPLIYFLDDDIHFGLKTRQIFEEILYNDRLLLTSVLTCMEYLVHPYRTNNQAKIKACADFLNDCHIPVLSINLEIATRAAQIRAAYKDFKSLDALQLATACVYGCDAFLTNDKQLRQFREIHCLTINDWLTER